jgi:hypothetical protein
MAVQNNMGEVGLETIVAGSIQLAHSSPSSSLLLLRSLGLPPFIPRSIPVMDQALNPEYS